MLLWEKVKQGKKRGKPFLVGIFTGSHLFLVGIKILNDG